MYLVEETYVNESYKAVIKQSGRWWIGWIEEVPLREALEFNRCEAIEAASESY